VRLGALMATLLMASASVLPLASAASRAPAQPADNSGKQDKEMLLKADEVEYDTDHSVSTARGHVEIDYAGKIVMADKVVYDQNADKVTAIGHVVMLDEDGNVGFTEKAVLTDQMRDGVLYGFQALVGKTGRLAGNHAVRTGGTRTVVTRGAYTNCKICNQPGQRVPVWEVEASRVIYDQPAHRIYYRDAVMDAFGIPFFYTPFYSTADPTVKRATGILTPEISDSSVLGYYTRIPVYVSLNDSQDFTIAPFLTSKAGDVLETEYRQRWDNGGFWLQPDVAYDSRAGIFNNQHQTYSSLFGSGLLQFDNTWHAGFDAQLTSDETWLEYYKISQAQRLQNDMYVEGISGRSRFEITGYFFQGLLATDQNSQFPIVLPLVEYSYIPESSLFGGDFRLDVNTAAVSREVGEDDQRLTAKMDWKFPVVTGNGQLITFAADVRGDVYHIDNPELGAVPTDSHFISRGLPYGAIDWRWPFVTGSPSGNTSYVFEPIVQVIGAPYGGNPRGIPNEDSTDFQFDETDIFSYDRSPGYDLVETGPRSNVGFRADAIYPSGSVELLVGDEFRLKPDPIFSEDSGFSGTRSDLVSRLSINFLPHFDFTERVDIDTSSGTFERNEVYVDWHNGRSSLEVSYLKVPEQEVTLGLPTREEINAQALVEVWKDWLVYAAGQRNLEQSTMIADEFGFGYDDECFGVSMSYRRIYTTDRNVPPSTEVLVRFNLKTSEGPTDHSELFPQHLYSHIAL
jgi:LPS-assembly protein